MTIRSDIKKKGIISLSREGYKRPMENEKAFQKAGTSWWNVKAFIIFMTVSMSCLDALVLFDILDQAMTQAEYLGKIVSFGVALVLNVIPLLVARFAHQAIYKTRRYAVTWVILLVTIYMIMFSATVFLRFAYKDNYGSSSDYHIINEMVENDVEQQEQEVDMKGLAVVLLLTVEPLVTSVVNFYLAFTMDDELKKQINHLRVRLLELDTEERELKAYLGAVEEPMVWKENALKQDQKMKEAYIKEIINRGNINRAEARCILAEDLGDPESISYVTNELG